MKTLNFAYQLVTACVPAIASSLLIGSGAEAATFAFSGADAFFSNFNLVPEFQEASANAETNAVSISGVVTADSDAEAVFFSQPPVGGNFAVAEVSGDGSEYRGWGESQAQIIGRFLISQNTANQVFKFDFRVNLGLEIAVDDVGFEQARASSEIAFSVFAGANPNDLSLVDSFILAGALNSADQADFLNVENSSNVVLNTAALTKLFGGLEESAIASVTGSYERSFVPGTYVTLVETKVSQASAQAVPEPSTMLAILLSGAMGIGLKRRKKTT